MVLLLVAELQILYDKAAAGRNLIRSIGVAGYDDRQLDDLLQLRDAGVQLALLVLRLVILGVLGQVAERARFFQLLGYLVRAGGFQIFQFFLISVKAVQYTLL